MGMNCRDPEALYHLIHSCKDPYDRKDKAPRIIYQVADEGKCDHLQLLRQRPVIPQAAPACQRSILADIEPSVAWGVGYFGSRETDGDKTKQAVMSVK